MKITFRIECPHCGWGHPWRDEYVNMGWLKMKCHHCEKIFHTKIAITGFRVKTTKELPKSSGEAITTLPEAQLEESAIDEDLLNELMNL